MFVFARKIHACHCVFITHGCLCDRSSWCKVFTYFCRPTAIVRIVFSFFSLSRLFVYLLLLIFLLFSFAPETIGSNAWHDVAHIYLTLCIYSLFKFINIYLCVIICFHCIFGSFLLHFSHLWHRNERIYEREYVYFLFSFFFSSVEKLYNLPTLGVLRLPLA